MSPISQFFDNTVDIKRLGATTGEDDTESWATHLEGVTCQIQPLEDSYGEDIEGSYGKDFLMFCSVIDVKQGDKVIDNSTEYIVQGVESYSWQGFSHIELRIRLTK